MKVCSLVPRYSALHGYTLSLSRHFRKRSITKLSERVLEREIERINIGGLEFEFEFVLKIPPCKIPVLSPYVPRSVWSMRSVCSLRPNTMAGCHTNNCMRIHDGHCTGSTGIQVVACRIS